MTEPTAGSKDVTARAAGGMNPRETDAVLRPAVDIHETAEGITLLADMPGVSRERLNIEVDRDALTIAGDARIEMPEGMEPLYADVRATRYRRSFALSGELDTDAIRASLRDGVLSVHIPRRAEVRPRKIEVHVD
jgi:HSP20 family molecular chaperone IbpA